VAQTQSHPLSQISPIDTNLDLNSRNITSLNYLLYTGGIFYSGSQGIPSADIATSAVTGAKIASGVITVGKMSNPLGGSINASAYYDSDNSNYYLDAAGTSTSLSVAGNVILDNSKALQIKDTGGTARSVLTLDSAGQVILRNTLGQTALNSVDGATYLYGSNGAGIIATFIDGKVGVNNTNPQYALDVNGSAKIRGPRLDIGSGTEVAGQIGGVNPWAGAGGLIFTTSGYWGGQYQFYSRPSGTETLAFTIDAADATGKILFGPNQDVNLYRSSANTLATDDSLNISGGVLISRDPNNFVTYSGPTTGGTGNYFFRSGVPGSYTDIMFIDGANARVGIRTSAPQQELEVVGDLNVTGTIYGSINTTGDVNCTGCVDTANIANSAVTSSKISDGSITSSDLSNPLGGSVNATAYYDSSNSNYFLDPASSGNALLVAGDTGIGTTNPAGKLVVYRNDATVDSTTVTNIVSEQAGAGDPYIDLLLSGVQRWRLGIDNSDSDKFMISSAAAFASNSKLTIDTDGHIGIGMTSPAFKLQVANTTTENATVAIISALNSDKDAILYVGEDSTAGGGIFYSGNGNRVGIFSGLGGPDDLRERISIPRSSGFVGINATNPRYTLEVNGNIKSQDKFVVGVDNNNQINSEEAWIFRAADRPEGTLTVQLGGDSAASTKWEIVDRAWTNVIAEISGEADSNSFVIQSDGDAIFNGGNVGIGTLTPTNTLNVIGDINATGTLYGTLASGSVVGSTIASGAVSATKLANPLGGSVNGTAYYDSDNSNYYLDPASSGTSLTTAGNIGIGTTTIVGEINTADANQYLWSPATSGWGIYWDTNAGGQFGNANTLGFMGGGSGTPRFSVDLDNGDGYFQGELGVGTTSPQSDLDVYDSDSNSSITIRSGVASWLHIYQPYNENQLRISAGGSETGTTDIATFTSSGRLGLGTTDPQTSLHIDETGTGVDSFSIYSLSDESEYWAVGIDDGSSNTFRITKGASLGATSDFLTINSNGNVGIGILASTEVPDTNGMLITRYSEPSAPRKISLDLYVLFS
jgi:hypothetical protein